MFELIVKPVVVADIQGALEPLRAAVLSAVAAVVLFEKIITFGAEPNATANVTVANTAEAVGLVPVRIDIVPDVSEPDTVIVGVVPAPGPAAIVGAVPPPMM